MAMNAKQAAEKWNISDRRVRTLCINGQIEGAYRIGKIWYIPDGTDKPKDGRIKTKESLTALIEKKKQSLILVVHLPKAKRKDFTKIL